MGHNKETILLVANYESGVGYAWWLMETFWAKIAEHYDEYNAILVYPTISTIPSTITEASIEVFAINFNKTTLDDVFTQCKFILKNKVKIIYFSDKSTWHWRYLLYRICGVKFIIIHDHSPGLRVEGSKIKSVVKTVANRTMLSVNGAIGATNFIKDRLHKVNKLPIHKCYVATNGLPPENKKQFKSDLHTLFNIPKKRRILIMTGRAVWYKGVDFVLNCMARLHPEKKEELHFIFIGDGPDLNKFISMAEDLRVQDFCSFLGRRDDVQSLLCGADIAIHSSRGEVGYSLSILEYMQAGLPVIVPDNPSVSGATINNYDGIIYKEGNVGEAVKALETLICDDSLRLRLGQQAKLSAKAYNLNNTHEQLIRAIDCILKS